MIERINQIKINFSKLTDSEVFGLLDAQSERVIAAQHDYNKVVGEAALRGLIPLERILNQDSRESK